jgi:hypothetical protein
MKKARIHASVDEIAKSLHGNWRPEHLFALKQALNAFDFMGTQLTECDQAWAVVQHIPGVVVPGADVASAEPVGFQCDCADQQLGVCNQQGQVSRQGRESRAFSLARRARFD